MLEAIRTVTHKIGKYAEITLNTCAYAGTGNVLKVQEMLRICAEHLTVILSLQFYRLYLPYLTINQSTLIHLYPKPIHNPPPQIYLYYSFAIQNYSITNYSITN